MSKFCVSLIAAALGCASANAAVIFAPTGAVIDVGGGGFGDIADTYNQNGLLTGYTSDVTDFDAYLAANPMHDSGANGEWFSNYNSTTATVTYDFGAIRGFDRLAFWNEEGAGVGALALLTSKDGEMFTALASFFPADSTDYANYPASIFTVTGTNARYVRLVMSNCPQSYFPACGMGEVAFRAAEVIEPPSGVPEPATWATMVGGFGLAGATLRRRKARLRAA